MNVNWKSYSPNVKMSADRYVHWIGEQNNILYKQMCSVAFFVFSLLISLLIVEGITYIWEI